MIKLSFGVKDQIILVRQNLSVYAQRFISIVFQEEALVLAWKLLINLW